MNLSVFNCICLISSKQFHLKNEMILPVGSVLFLDMNCRLFFCFINEFNNASPGWLGFLCACFVKSMDVFI